MWKPIVAVPTAGAVLFHARCPMTTAQTDPVRAAYPEDPRDDNPVHVYAWYDPDAATFDLDDPFADLEPLTDEDAFATVDKG